VKLSLLKTNILEVAKTLCYTRYIKILGHGIMMRLVINWDFLRCISCTWYL